MWKKGFLIMALTLAFTPSTVMAQATRLSAKAPLSGNGFSWDGKTLTLTDYSGGAFEINEDAVVILEGNNAITAEHRDVAGIVCYGNLVVDGKSSGKLDITATDSFGLRSGNGLILKDMDINIRSVGDLIGLGISVSPTVPGDEPGIFSMINVSGEISASSEEGDTAAVHSFVPIKIEGTAVDKEIGMLIEPDDMGDHEYSFMKGDKTVFYSEQSFESARAERVVLNGNGFREKRKDILVSGETVDLRQYFADSGDGVKCALKTGRKRASIKDGWRLKAKKKGDLIVQLLNTDGNSLGEKSLTVIRKPKLRFPKEISYEENMTMDPYDYFQTRDTLFTVADSWSSSDPSVASVDTATGKITVKGKGKATISAMFGDIKVCAKLKVI